MINFISKMAHLGFYWKEINSILKWIVESTSSCRVAIHSAIANNFMSKKPWSKQQNDYYEYHKFLFLKQISRKQSLDNLEIYSTFVCFKKIFKEIYPSKPTRVSMRCLNSKDWTITNPWMNPHLLYLLKSSGMVRILFALLHSIEILWWRIKKIVDKNNSNFSAGAVCRQLEQLVTVIWRHLMLKVVNIDVVILFV